MAFMLRSYSGPSRNFNQEEAEKERKITERSTFTPLLVNPVAYPRFHGEPPLITRACTRVQRARVRCARPACVQVSFNGRSASNGSGARRSSEWGPQTSGRAGGSLTLRFYFLRSFPPAPRLFSWILAILSYDGRARLPRTYTYSRRRQTAKIASSPRRPSSRSWHPFTKFVLLLFSFRGRRSGGSFDDRRDRFLTFCLTRRSTNVYGFLSPLRQICNLYADVELILCVPRIATSVVLYK